MRKLMGAVFLICCASASAQTLFYYGKDSVAAADFLAAWHKNNTGAATEKAFNDYLHLYVASRLKIAEAKSLGYDTLPQLVADLNGLRQQILPAYLSGKSGLDKLTAEAVQRSRKDINVSHIFISLLQDGVYDSAKALKKIQAAQAALKSGAPFSSVANQFSDDPAAKANGGRIGYITVFTLPYELENVVYGTPTGTTSVPYLSHAGYHIFKVEGERKAIGKVKAAQIMLALPPGADAGTKASVKHLADSLYSLLVRGGNFASLAKAYSNDAVSAYNNGEMPDFGVGQYDAGFENAVLALPADGAITKPFMTAQGYHIVKRLRRVPVSTDSAAMQALKTSIERSDRINVLQREIAQKIVLIDLLEQAFSKDALWLYTDSILAYKPIGKAININSQSYLFTIGNKTYTAADWISFAQQNRYNRNGNGTMPYAQLWNDFKLASATAYYQDHLEEFNPDFKQQVAEFKEGNLFFEIMQRQIWNKAQTDTVALQNYYTSHKANYNWKQSADAVIFYTADAATAKAFHDAVKKNPSGWRSSLNNYGDKITADSSRFESEQIPNAGKIALVAGAITDPVISSNDQTASFAYIFRLHNQPEPRSFEDARGLVINDYQSQLEKEWVALLEKKYPVRFNQQTLAVVRRRFR